MDRPPRQQDVRSHRDARPEVTVGSKLGNYRLQSYLGRGGQAIVFLAEDVVLRRHAAVKVFTDPHVRNELLGEGRLIAKLSHPNIVQVYHLELSADIRYMAMEFIRGGDLVDRVQRLGPLTPAQALERTTEVLLALQHAHDLGVVHRDVKPQNLLGAIDNTIKLADFGLATIVQDEWETNHVRAVGTPLYMAPEVWQGAPPSPASDLYGLGCVLYFMLMGDAPFTAYGRDGLRRAHLEARPRFPTSVPEPLVRLIHRLMAKDPAQRLATAADALVAVAECAEELGFAAKRTTSPRPKISADAHPGERAEQAIIELPPLGQVTALVGHAILSGATLVTLAGQQLHYLERIVETAVHRNGDDVSTAAVVRLSARERAELPQILRTMLRSQLSMTMHRDPSVRSNEREAIVRALAPDNRRRVFPIIVNRTLAPSEVLFLVGLLNDAHGANLCLVVVCREAQAAPLAQAVEQHGHVAHAEFIEVPSLTPEQALAHLRVWIRAAGIPPSRRWSSPALALATDLALHHPAQTLRILKNAEILASRLEIPVLTTWCLRGGAQHPGTLLPNSVLLTEWRMPPKQWPDPAELERWTKLPRLASWNAPVTLEPEVQAAALRRGSRS